MQTRRTTPPEARVTARATQVQGEPRTQLGHQGEKGIEAAQTPFGDSGCNHKEHETLLLLLPKPGEQVLRDSGVLMQTDHGARAKPGSYGKEHPLAPASSN